MRLVGVTLVMGALPALALTSLFDFEDDADVAAWQIRSAGQDKLVRSEAFATSGVFSAVFTTPAWKDGLQEWPALEAAPPVKDWSPYDRLVLDLVNPTDTLETVNLYITDAKTPFRKGYFQSFALQPRSHQRAPIALASFPEHISRADISLLHFFTTRPAEDFCVHLDNISLLKKGEAPPAVATLFVKQIIELCMRGEPFSEIEQRLAETTTQVDELGWRKRHMRAWARKRLGELRDDVADARSALEGPDATLEAIDMTRQTIEALSLRTQRLDALLDLRKAWRRKSNTSEYMVGFASSMDKVLPRDVAPPMEVRKRVRVSLARNETESFQVVVLPFEQPLKGACVKLGPLRNWHGDTIAADVRLVGYVETRRPSYEVPYVGWWPDPLLDFVSSATIAPNDAQAFWVRIRASADQTPGVYRGQLYVLADNAPSTTFRVEVHVNDFAMPMASPLPTAMSMYDQYARNFAPDWEKVKPVWADFLADYYIDYDSLYRAGPPDYELLSVLERQGRLVAFNLGFFSGRAFTADMTDDQFEQTLGKIMEGLRASYDGARAAGLLDKAYIYGFDECNPDMFPTLRHVTQRLREAFPEVPVMTTSRDHSYGEDSGIVEMDAWCPLTPQFDIGEATKARARGTAVWWYICCGPRHPYANWFVEYPAIEARLLMGFMTAKYRPDGFLYYALTRWPNNEKPIESGPFTEWNPASFRDFNGDGSILCPGPGGRPLATIRLENFRDGLEDYAYVRILEATVERVREELSAEKSALPYDLAKRRKQAWLTKAERLLEVPEDVVKDLSHYTLDSENVDAYRAALAKAIAKAPVPPVYPWDE